MVETNSNTEGLKGMQKHRRYIPIHQGKESDSILQTCHIQEHLPLLQLCNWETKKIDMRKRKSAQLQKYKLSEVHRIWLTHRWYSMYRVKQCLDWFVVGKRKSAGAVSSWWITTKYTRKRQIEGELEKKIGRSSTYRRGRSLGQLEVGIKRLCSNISHTLTIIKK